MGYKIFIFSAWGNNAVRTEANGWLICWDYSYICTAQIISDLISSHDSRISLYFSENIKFVSQWRWYLIFMDKSCIVLCKWQNRVERHTKYTGCIFRQPIKTTDMNGQFSDHKISSCQLVFTIGYFPFLLLLRLRKEQRSELIHYT